MSMEYNPYHAWKHLESSRYLSLQDQQAAKILWKWGRSRDKDANNRLKAVQKIRDREARKDEHIAALEARLAGLEVAMAALEEGDE